MDDLEGWLGEGDAPEADWGPHLLRLANRGELGHVGRRWFLDLPALAQRHACRPAECTPGLRAPRTKSCCADLEVGLTEEEVGAITAAEGEVAAFLSTRDPRWAKGAPAWHDGDGGLLRPGRRCVFSVTGPDGLRCGLHALEDATKRARGSLKPLPCRLFPLAVVDLDDGRWLLTAIHRRTASSLGAPPAGRFPCLRDDPDRPLLIDEARDPMVALVGARTFREMRARVREWASGG